MNKKIIGVFAILILIGVVIFVVAEINDEGSIIVSIYVSEGWNLVSNGIFTTYPLENSEIKAQDILAIYYYDANDKKYYQVSPNDENNILGTNKGYQIIEQVAPAAWVYSKKSGNLVFKTDDIYPASARPVFKGWNLISLTPSLVENSENPDLTFDEIKGTCDIEKAYLYSPQSNKWVAFNMPEMDSTLLGHGMAIKVSNNCKLGTSSSGGIAPPGLPGGGGDNAGIRKEIEDLYYLENNYEICELNPYQNEGFNSKEQCNNVLRCFGEELAKLVPESDLESLKSKMEEEGGEGATMDYFEQNPAVKTQFETRSTLCLSKYNYNG